MSMPKGFKTQNGYGTTKDLGGSTYHEVASKMNDLGYKMNHSTARNIYVSALIKIARNVTDLYQVENSEKDLKKIAINPDFQTAISSFMKE
tara:strand:- start:1108 stop:1380 length:273 start_codon:yes stop_codon:yes gene_type:complete